MSFDRAWCLVAALVQHLREKADAALELDTTTAAVHAILSAIKEKLALDRDTDLDTLLLAAAEASDDRLVNRFLFDCISICTEADSWEKVKAVFHSELATPRKEAYRTLAEQLSNLIFICRKALNGQPHLEFLFRNLCASPSLCSIVASDPHSQFKQLFDDINYNTADSEQALAAEIRDFTKLH